MITDADIDKLKAVFATKDDLNRFATKDDFNDIREDLSKMEVRMTKTIVNAVMEVYDYLAKQDEEIKPMKREQRGQRVAIADLESRVTTLESARA